MQIQEVANLMYAISLLTFDADNVPTSQCMEQALKGTKTVTNTDILFDIHTEIILKFHTWKEVDFEQENYDQFEVYFEFMRTIPYAVEWITSLIGYMPQASGPCAPIPSVLHTKTIQATMANLDPSEFSVFHEFNGLRGGVFPIDCAVYYHDKLLAFIEVDGNYHYKNIDGEFKRNWSEHQLRRKDRLKESLYKNKFPHIPLYRIRSDQVNALGFEKIGQVMASWLTLLVSKQQQA